MTQDFDAFDLNEELIERLVTAAIHAGMNSPLRETIVAAVADSAEEQGTDVPITTDESAADEREPEAPAGTSRARKSVQGLMVFLVMFAVLYVTLKRLMDAEEQ